MKLIDGRVVAACAFQVDGSERFHRHMCPHRHRRVVAGRQRERRRTIVSWLLRIGSFHQQQFSHEPIERAPAVEIDWTYSMTVCRREQALAIRELWRSMKSWFAGWTSAKISECTTTGEASHAQ